MQRLNMKKCLTLIKLVILLLLVGGCDQEMKLKGYYDLYLLNDNYPAGAYKFYKDGRCFYYKYNRSTDERYLFDFGDVIPINTWSSRGDTLIIMNYKYKVVRQVSDTLVLKALGNSKDRTLVKSKRQEDE